MLITCYLLEVPLIYKKSYGRTEEGSITLGWKFELLNVEGGQLSGKMKLTKKQIIDIYSGTNLDENKRNAYVNGEVIVNSGIANYILFEDSPIKTLQDAINKGTSNKSIIKVPYMVVSLIFVALHRKATILLEVPLIYFFFYLIQYHK